MFRYMLVIFATIGISFLFGKGVPNNDSRVFATNGEPIFSAITRLAALNRLPVGIVVADSSSLCRATPLERYSLAPAAIVSRLLLKTSYTANFDDGIIYIAPNHMSSTTQAILDTRFKTFSVFATTFNGVGQVLTNYIQAKLQPEKGRAGSILSSSSMELLPALTLNDLSVKDIANHVVSLDGKGMWVMQAAAQTEKDQVPKEYGSVEIYGYKDDAGRLENAVCNRQSVR